MAFGKSSKDPFSTPVGHLIERNTSKTQQPEDWGQFMNICDCINLTVEGPKDAVKALKKRISKNYNHKELKLSLSLLEMCMQNCIPAFQSLVVKKEFCKDVLVKMLNPKYNLPVQMQNKILHFIMTWPNAFQGSVDTSEVREVYLELIKKGIKFPSLDSKGELESQIQEISVESNRTLASCPTESTPVHLPPESTTVNLAPEQIGKLYSEMDMVKMNVKVMSEILLENMPGTEKPEDMELLQELQKACREMQRRIVKLLETVQNVDVIVELVQVNDDLNNVFLRYERFSRTRANRPVEQRRPTEIPLDNNNHPTAPSLIDFDCSSPNTDQHMPINNFPVPTGHFPAPVPESSTAPASVSDTAVPVQPVPENLKPFMYPQMDLLELRQAVNTPFSYPMQNQVPGVSQSQTYDNIASTTNLPLEIPTLHPMLVPLQNEPVKQPLQDSKPDDSTNPSQPIYYDLLEFDPLVETNGNHVMDPIYEEIDCSMWKAMAKKDTSC